VEVRPVFKDLDPTELLRKCEKDYTQNSNESINNLVWKYCPKEKHHGLVTVEASVAIGVCIFNDGFRRLGQILEAMDITVGRFAVTFFEDKDVFRIITAERQAQMATKESRKRKRLKRLGRDEDQAGRERFPYLARGY